MLAKSAASHGNVAPQQLPGLALHNSTRAPQRHNACPPPPGSGPLHGITEQSVAHIQAHPSELDPPPRNANAATAKPGLSHAAPALHKPTEHVSAAASIRAIRRDEAPTGTATAKTLKTQYGPGLPGRHPSKKTGAAALSAARGRAPKAWARWRCRQERQKIFAIPPTSHPGKPLHPIAVLPRAFTMLPRPRHPRGHHPL